MVRIDSLKLKFSDIESTFRNINKEAFYKEIIEDNDNIIMTRYKLKDDYKPYGLKSLSLDFGNNQGILELSSKALQKYYYHLINKESLGHLIYNLNKNNFSQIDIQNFIVKSQVLKVDVTNNIKIDKPIKEYISQIQTLFNPKLRMIAVKNESVIFKNDVKNKRYKIRQIYYDKFKEVSRYTKDNQELWKYFDPSIMKDTLRIESNIVSFGMMRKLFNVESNSLTNILCSNENVNLNIFNKITKGICDIEDREKNKCIENVIWSEFEKVEGRKKIIIDNNYDINRIMAKLKSVVKGNLNRYKKNYVYLIQQMKSEGMGNSRDYFEVIRKGLENN
jgi:hypothetical protein